jgi:hypothetical protein
MSDQIVREILVSAKVLFHPHKVSSSKSLRGGVYITAANQLVGTYDNLKSFQRLSKEYSGWEAHHVVEKDDLDRLGVGSLFPAGGDQICVLIPERAHRGRINTILPRENPRRWSATAEELLEAYRSAYDLIGDYCGGGEKFIRHELVEIVKAIFRRAGIKTLT